MRSIFRDVQSRFPPSNDPDCLVWVTAEEPNTIHLTAEINLAAVLVISLEACIRSDAMKALTASDTPLKTPLHWIYQALAIADAQDGDRNTLQNHVQGRTVVFSAKQALATVDLQHPLAAQMAIHWNAPVPDTTHHDTCGPDNSLEDLRVGLHFTSVKIEGQLRPVLVEQW